MPHEKPNSEVFKAMAESAAELQKELESFMEENVWPDGMVREDDEGVLPLLIGVEKGRVTLRFPKPVDWIGFTGDQATEIANLLIKHARIAGGKKPL